MDTITSYILFALLVSCVSIVINTGVKKYIFYRNLNFLHSMYYINKKSNANIYIKPFITFFSIVCFGLNLDKYGFADEEVYESLKEFYLAEKHLDQALAEVDSGDTFVDIETLKNIKKSLEKVRKNAYTINKK